MCALVIGIYAYAAHSGPVELLSPNAADTYYNLLVQGFRSGHLSLKKDVPPGLAQLADPYDPTANAPYRADSYGMLDMSYYKGKLYLYFGVTPALILFWPFVTLTGHYLFHRQAVAVFCAIAFLANVGLLRAMWKRYFPEVSVGVVAACTLALGLATGVPVFLPRSDVWEVPVSCGYMLTMLALGAIWCALHEPDRRCWWLAAASVAYGLAVGARPTLLFGAVILLVPVAQARRERQPIWALLMAATGPIMLIGLGLMLYNALRFDNPFEFGFHHLLDPLRCDTLQLFSAHNLWSNFRVYCLEPASWSSRFPFVQYGMSAPPSPPWKAFGILLNIPLVWLALVVPLAWRGRSAEVQILRWFAMAIAILFGVCALTMCTFSSTCMRYEMDFLPALVLLAVVGILGLERALATPGAQLAQTSKSGLADRPVWRRVVRWGWGLLLGFSVAFNLFAGIGVYAMAHCYMGNALSKAGKIHEAIGHYELVLRIRPDWADAHYNLGTALQRVDRLDDAIGHYKQALQIKPDFAEVHCNLGLALWQAGKLQEAVWHYEQALRIKPDLLEAHYNLGVAFERAGRVQEAIGHYEQALRIKPDHAEAHNSLGAILLSLGKVTEAIEHYQQALRLKPDYAEPHIGLATALMRVGRVQEAIEHYQQALQIKPDLAELHNNIGIALLHVGKLNDATAHFEKALRINPNSVEANYNLGVALEQAGKTQEAIGHYEQALRIKPDLAEAQNRLARLRTVQ